MIFRIFHTHIDTKKKPKHITWIVAFLVVHVRKSPTDLASTAMAALTTSSTTATTTSSPVLSLSPMPPPSQLSSTTTSEVTSNTSATASTPPTPNLTFEVAVNQLQQQQQQQQQPFSRPLITIATQTALRRQDLPWMHNLDYDASTTNNSKIASNGFEEVVVPSTDLTPCPTCSRKFNVVSLSKHVVICEKMAMKKRKPFDSSRQRREGTELAAYLPKNFGLPANKQMSEYPFADEKFVRNTARSSMRKQSIASTASNGSVNTTVSMPTSPKPTALSLARSRHNSTERPKRNKITPPASEQCPHCERFFGIKAYDRHVEWCKEKSLQLAIKNSGNSEKDKAKERLVARTKYRAPIKTKRSLNREKYAGAAGDENDEYNENFKLDSGNTLMTSSVASDSNEDDVISQYSLELPKEVVTLKTSEAATNTSQDLDNMSANALNFNSEAQKTTPHAEEAESAKPQLPTLLPQPILPSPPQFDYMAFGTSIYNPFVINPFIMANLLQQMLQHYQQQIQTILQHGAASPLPCFNPIHGYLQNNPQTMQRNAIQNFNDSLPNAFCGMPLENVYLANVLTPIEHNLERGLNDGQTDADNSASNVDASSTLVECEQSNQSDQVQITVEKFFDMKYNKVLVSALINSAYDPFLAAKRQLEELCAPDSPPDNDTRFNTKTLSTPTTPSPMMPTNKMTTSLNLGSTLTPIKISSPLTPNLNVRRFNNTTTTTAPTASNFRRTSSLRGPRRSPLLPARPLFAQKRPTIQRGLSDEGPISTNFLKSEEYDEMPVRSNCVNDFAITNSPRVVRRDTSLSNRKNSLKLTLNSHGSRENSPSGVNVNIDKTTISNAPRDISKTDSLAVFLKYEKELEKLANTSAKASDEQRLSDQDFKRSNDTIKIAPSLSEKAEDQSKPNPIPLNSDTISTSNVDASSNLAFTKELKDKSNTLSKQNSAKSLKLEHESPEINKAVAKESPKTPLEQSLSPPYGQNMLQIRLEPLEHRGSQIPQPVSNSNNPNLKRAQTALPPLSQPTITNQASNLESPFNNSKPQHQTQKEHKALASSAEFIDPKLINKCDNLPVKLADLKFVDSDSSTEQQQQQQPQRCDRATDPYDNSAAPISQLSKLLPLTNKSNASMPTMRNAQTQSTPKHTRATSTQQAPATLLPQQTPIAINSNDKNNNNNGVHRRNSIESNNSRNPLKRKMRLGRNQFLYDASPEALDSVDSACSADDEANPRSSAEYSPQLHSAFEQMLHQQAPHFHTNVAAMMQPETPPPASFDDFDFDQFLSSFENDEEDLPIFRDCREFFKNRHTKTNKQQQLQQQQQQQKQQQRTSTINNRNHSTTPKQIPQMHGNFFRFPTLNTNLPQLVTPSSSSTRRSDSKHSVHSVKDMLMNDLTKSGDYYGDVDLNDFQRRRNSGGGDDNDADAGSQKREIFISIETEQSDELLDRNPISPNSLRHMVGGNPQTLVEVEVDANDNKFSKISDDDDNNNGGNATIAKTTNCMDQTTARGRHLLPNVQLNNAKNLRQQPAHTADDMVNLMAAINAGDSDEMSSLDGYPLGSSAGSFRRSAGVASKTSADSAYGSLSRQRSNEMLGKAIPLARSSNRTRPATANTTNTKDANAVAAAQMQQRQFLQQQMLHQQQQQQIKFAQAMMNNARSRQLSASSSSGSDNSLPPILVANSANHHFQQQQHQLLMQHQQQQQQQQQYQQNKARSRVSPNATFATALDLLNANHTGMMMSSTPASMPLASPTATANNNKPMSRFCHECGGKFLVEQAKFCTDCGVKRLMI